MIAGSRLRELVALLTLAGLLVVFVLPASRPRTGGASVSAQETTPREKSPEDSSAASENAESPSLPHGQFLIDYLIVLILIVGAVYAVCRPSRRA